MGLVNNLLFGKLKKQALNTDKKFQSVLKSNADSKHIDRMKSDYKVFKKLIDEGIAEKDCDKLSDASKIIYKMSDYMK